MKKKTKKQNRAVKTKTAGKTVKKKGEKKRGKILTVLIPVYNEERTISEILYKVRKNKLPGISMQIVIVDDNSTDSTKDIIRKEAKKDKRITVIYKEKNEGKGSAIIEGIKHIKGDYTIIQDADLEYDPEDYGILLYPITKGHADVVFGSRFIGTHRAFLFMNYMANKILNLITNIMYDSILTDMETCYKMFRSDIIKDLHLESKGFDIEPEITAKILKRKYRVYEVPIHYYGRTYEEGKKIKASDAFFALFALIKFKFKK